MPPRPCPLLSRPLSRPPCSGRGHCQRRLAPLLPCLLASSPPRPRRRPRSPPAESNTAVQGGLARVPILVKGDAAGPAPRAEDFLPGRLHGGVELPVRLRHPQLDQHVAADDPRGRGEQDAARVPPQVGSPSPESVPSPSPRRPRPSHPRRWHPRTLPAPSSGNVIIETAFYDDQLLVCKMLLRVFYDQ